MIFQNVAFQIMVQNCTCLEILLSGAGAELSEWLSGGLSACPFLGGFLSCLEI